MVKLPNTPQSNIFLNYYFILKLWLQVVQNTFFSHDAEVSFRIEFQLNNVQNPSPGGPIHGGNQIYFKSNLF